MPATKLDAPVLDRATAAGAANMEVQRSEALLKAGALQNALLTSANFSIIATDTKGVIQLFNVGAERMLGYEAADVMNKITPADISDPQEVIARAETLSAELGIPITPGFEALVFKASRGIEDIYELTYIRKDGSRFPAVVSVTALRDAQDAIIGYLLIGTDNTARKRIEADEAQISQRLRDHQFYIRSLFESNIDALMTTDPSGIITDVNKQMETLTGCTRDELIGAAFKNYFTDAARAQAGIKLVLSKKNVTNYGLTARARDGKETVVSLNATTFYDRDRRLQGVFAAARDITERKRAEEQLVTLNAELEARIASRTEELTKSLEAATAAERAKSDFMANVTHELRTPLNAVIGFAELLKDEVPGPLNAKQAAFVVDILASGKQLLMLVEGILEMSRLDAAAPLEREPVQIGAAIEACVAARSKAAEQRRVRITVEIAANTGQAALDPKALRRMLDALIDNAIKFNRHGGAVVVRAQRAGGALEIAVADTGIGIAGGDLAKLFKPLAQLDAGLTRRYGGVGLGLALARRLAELQGGTIEVESESGKGSTFTLRLPVQEGS